MDSPHATTLSTNYSRSVKSSTRISMKRERTYKRNLSHVSIPALLWLWLKNQHRPMLQEKMYGDEIDQFSSQLK